MRKLILLFLIVFISSNVLALTSFSGVSNTASFVRYQNPDFRDYYSGSQIKDYWPILQEQREMCESRQDLLIQVAPLGCQPAVVRSDLIAEQDVPVFCQLDALRLNPLIDIKQIRSISFGGNYPSSVAGIGFHPAKAALRSSNELLGSPLLNNIGYVVVVMKRNANESSLPSFVNFTLNAKVDYYAGNAMGIGSNSFLLQETTDSEWESSKNKQSFLNGRFYLRLDSVDDTNARISIYEGDRQLSSITVKRGSLSSPIYLPGSYCEGSVQVSYDGYSVAQRIARVQVDNDILELNEGSSFLNNKCRVSRIIAESNFTSRVELSCGSQKFALRLAPREFASGDGVYLVKNGIVDESSVWTITSVIRGSSLKYRVTSSGNSLEVDSSNIRAVSKNVLTDVTYDSNAERYFKNAIDSYVDVADDYPSERPSGTENLDVRSYGEQSYERAIALAQQFGKQRTAVELINEYISKYPDSANSSAFSNSLAYDYRYDSSNAFAVVDIDNGFKTIRLLDVSEPNKQSKASFSWGSSNVFDVNLYGNYGLNGIGNFTIQSLTKDEVRLNALCYNDRTRRYDSSNPILRLGNVGNDIDRTKTVCNQVLRLENIETEEYAKIRISPVTSRPSSTVNFSIGVGIEKRAIKLTPEKTQDRINSLNESIAKWDRLSTNLGNVVSGMKAACFATAGVLTVKNFVGGLSGEALARQEVMSGSDGWTAWCQKQVNNGVYDSMGQCYSENSGKIDQDVRNTADLMNSYNEDIKAIEDPLKKSSGVFGEYVDGEAAKNEYIEKELASYGDKTVRVGDRDVRVSELTKEVNQNGENKRLLSYEEAKDLRLYLDLRDKASSDVSKNLAESNLRKLGTAISDRQQTAATRSSLSSTLGSSSLGSSIGIYGSKNALNGEYNGGVVDSSVLGKIDGLDSADSGKPAQIVSFDGTLYLVVLEQTQGNDYRPAKYYKLSGNPGSLKASAVDSIPNAQFRNFKKVSREDCRNPIVNPEVKYYETEPYKGMPAVVPFDIEEGWYTATRQSLPAFGGVKAFESSGRPVSFWVCNVGGDGEVDFYVSGFDDDTCQQFNLETGAALNKFSCLSESETKDVVDRAYRALNDAAQQHKAGLSFARIEGRSVKVGPPAVNLPGTQCQDFMSPEDCKLMFNVCDPVICPASRCNFGGQFPVADVIQSGVIGSTLLCLPNAKEGVVVPVCLSGIKAGLDGYLSILKSYQQCLQENLDSGKNVGICDQISSVYLCEFFWRQAAPVANVLLPKLAENLYGQGQVRGGGEYLTVQAAWDNAQGSANYFTQNYAANSLKAFNVRSVEEAGSEVCRAFVSAKAPTSFKSLVEPDSPSQFHAWFSESTYSDVTVPSTSQYKLFYHIYSGNDQGVSYAVYLKDPPASSYYQSSPTVQVISGYVNRGSYKTETRDFTAPSGYKQLCVRINDQEECGFKQVTSSAALDILKDGAVADQIKQDDISGEAECISGRVNAAALLNPNLEAAAQEAVNPEIYKRGVSRICATNNPGQSTDPRRFLDVGNCGDVKVRCWLDTQSIDNALESQDYLIRNRTLSEVEKNIDSQLVNSGDYLVGDEAQGILRSLYGRVFDSQGALVSLTTSESEKIAGEADDLNPKLILNVQKAELLYLKGAAYESAARGLQINRKPVVEANVPGEFVGPPAPEVQVQEGLSLSSTYSSDSAISVSVLDNGEKTKVYLKGESVYYDVPNWIDKKIGVVNDNAVDLVPGSKADIGPLYDELEGATIEGKNIGHSSLGMGDVKITEGITLSANYDASERINLLEDGEEMKVYFKNGLVYQDSNWVPSWIEGPIGVILDDSMISLYGQIETESADFYSKLHGKIIFRNRVIDPIFSGTYMLSSIYDPDKANFLYIEGTRTRFYFEKDKFYYVVEMAGDDVKVIVPIGDVEDKGNFVYVLHLNSKAQDVPDYEEIKRIDNAEIQNREVKLN